MIDRNYIRGFKNIPGWHTKRKIVVIESDDWGSIRMPSHHALKSLQKEGLDLNSGDSYRFNAFDTLASAEDITALFNVLSSHKDSKGSCAKFTALSVMTNPDFERIRDSNFSEYFYEPFTETLTNYHMNDLSFKLWQEGINLGIFIPQFHGREHLNVRYWMRDLQKNNSETRLAFEQGLWGFRKKDAISQTLRYQAAFDIADIVDLDYHSSVLVDGLNLFQKAFGYRARYFVPPNGQINNSLNEVLVKSGIDLRSTTTIQKEPKGNGAYKKIPHYLGQKSKHGLAYIIRNSVFEPSSKSRDWVDSCLNDISNAFRWRKPAIINSHRVNYIGVLDESNRDHGLRQLDLLLTNIIKHWPEVEFLSTTQLGDILNSR